MSEAAILWLFGTVIGIQTVALGFLGKLVLDHFHDCRDFRSLVSKIDANVDRIKMDIGDHQSGMRGDLHRHGSDLQYHGSCIWLVAEKLGVELPPPEKKR